MKFRIDHLIPLTLVCMFMAAVGHARDVMRYERLTTSDGLSHHMISSIEQDSAGTLWIATWNGLCSWDSLHGFTAYNEALSPDGKMLKLGRLIYAAPVEGGQIWCLDLNRDRRFLFDPATRRVTPDRDRPYRRRGTRPYLLRLDSAGLHIGHEAAVGLAHPSVQADYVVPFPEGHRLVSDSRITGLCDRSGALWVSFDNALYHIAFHPAPSEVCTTEDWTSAGAPYGDEVRALLLDSRRQLWVAAKTGFLYVYDSEGALLRCTHAGGRVYAMMEDSRGRVWLATKGDGLRVDGRQWTGWADDTLALRECYDLRCWRDELLVATWGQGVVAAHMAGDSLSDFRRVLPEGKVRALRAVPPWLADLGVALCACTTQGIALLDTTLHVVGHVGDVDVSDIVWHEEQAYVSTMGTGLYRWTAPTAKEPFGALLPQDAPVDVVLSLASVAGALWVVGSDRIEVWRADGQRLTLGSEWFGEPLLFSEAHPVERNGQWLAGTKTGLVALRPAMVMNEMPTAPTAPVETAGASVGRRARRGLWWGVALVLLAGGLAVRYVRRGRRPQTAAAPDGEALPAAPSTCEAPALQVVPREDASATAAALPAERAATPAATSPFGQQVSACIHAHYADADLTAEQVAEELGMGRSAFFSRIKADLHTTWAALLLEVRMQHACQMLADDAASVAEVAYSCGFSDAKYFGRVFKKQTGMTPHEYKTARRTIGESRSGEKC